MFVKAEHTIITLSKRSTCDTGMVLCKIQNFFSLPITLSTCILTFESWRDLATSLADSWLLPGVELGIRRVAPTVANSSWI